MESYVLTLIIFFPLLGMVALWCLPGQAHDLIKKVALGFTIPPLLCGIYLYTAFDGSNTGLQFVVNVPWIPSFNIHYFVGVDGVSITMVLLSVLLCPDLYPGLVGDRSGGQGLFCSVPPA